MRFSPALFPAYCIQATKSLGVHSFLPTTVGLVCYARLNLCYFLVLCDFYLCDTTMSQTPPSKVGSGHETVLPALVVERNISP